MKESEVQKAITNGLHAMRISSYRMNSGTFINKETNTWIMGQKAGCADLCVEYPLNGHYLIAWIEVKLPTTKLSYNQIRFLKEVHSKHIPWLVATEWDDVERWLKDPEYHGDVKHTACVLDPNYVHVIRMPRASINKPNPYQGLIDQRNARIINEDLARGEPPF